MRLHKTFFEKYLIFCLLLVLVLPLNVLAYTWGSNNWWIKVDPSDVVGTTITINGTVYQIKASPDGKSIFIPVKTEAEINSFVSSPVGAAIVESNPNSDCNATGGAIVDTDGYRIHTFTSSGTFTAANNCQAQVLVVAGGGAGGPHAGGGGGGGGVIYNSSVAISSGATTVTVGAGGVGNDQWNRGTNGGNSVFGSLTAIGGGGGSSTSVNAGADGGSGGGATRNCGNVSCTSVVGLGTPGQGYNGGAASLASGSYQLGAGGGGAGGVGGDAGGMGGYAGAGGIGVQYSISGTAKYYGGGGGGSVYFGSGYGNKAGAGGLGGGGDGAPSEGAVGENGEANTGGGGGASGSNTNAMSGAGGSGVVIVRYPHVAQTVYASCKAILDAGASTGNGLYTIDPDGSGGSDPFQVYCEMTIDGGGWTILISHPIAPTTQNPLSDYGTVSASGAYSIWSKSAALNYTQILYKPTYNANMWAVLTPATKLFKYSDSAGTISSYGATGGVGLDVGRPGYSASSANGYGANCSGCLPDGCYGLQLDEEPITWCSWQGSQFGLSGGDDRGCHYDSWDYRWRYTSGSPYSSQCPTANPYQSGYALIGVRGGTSASYASCKAILAASPLSVSGVYTIDPDGTGGNDPFEAYCDMTTDGGGWTLLLNVDTSDTAVRSWGDTTFWLGNGTVSSAGSALTADYKGKAFSLMPLNGEIMVWVHNEGSTSYGRAVYDVLEAYRSSTLYARMNAGDTILTGDRKSCLSCSGIPNSQTDTFIGRSQAIELNEQKSGSGHGSGTAYTYARIATANSDAYGHWLWGLGGDHDINCTCGHWGWAYEAQAYQSYCNIYSVGTKNGGGWTDKGYLDNDSCNAGNMELDYAIFVRENFSCPVCQYASGGSCVYSNTSTQCSTASCSSNNSYYISGEASATGTNYTYLRSYSDANVYCNGSGSCNNYTCNSYSDSLSATCGLCKYATGDASGCANYASGTNCGANSTCDGSGNCVNNTPCNGTGGTITRDASNNCIHTFTSSGTFTSDSALTAEVLVVAGGGSGGKSWLYGGGGGGGGVIYNSSYSIAAQSYSVTVGAGGSSGVSPSGANGGNSVFGTLTAIGGGHGGSFLYGNDAAANGEAGGSGGGAATRASDHGSGSAGAGTSGQGYAGGVASGYVSASGHGGGGGAGGAGSNGSYNNSANGGPGVQYSISGTATYYGGGGGGGSQFANYGGAGGIGGGGRGGSFGAVYAAPGTANTGGGGGGSADAYSNSDGGSGIVIIKYTPISGTIVGGAHTLAQCTAAGGAADSAGGTLGTNVYLCKFLGTNVSCPSGWTQHNNWQTYSSVPGSCDACGRHCPSAPTTWSDMQQRRDYLDNTTGMSAYSPYCNDGNTGWYGYWYTADRVCYIKNYGQDWSYNANIAYNEATNRTAIGCK